MLSAVIPAGLSYPAVDLAVQLERQTPTKGPQGHLLDQERHPLEVLKELRAQRDQTLQVEQVQDLRVRDRIRRLLQDQKVLIHHNQVRHLRPLLLA